MSAGPLPLDPTTGITNAMLKQLAPKANTPPSPKNKACIANAALTATTAAHGPRSTATKTAPTAWAVVPSGIGTLNIMTTNENALPSASMGTWRVPRRDFSRAAETAHAGIVAAPSTAHVPGER